MLSIFSSEKKLKITVSNDTLQGEEAKLCRNLSSEMLEEGTADAQDKNIVLWAIGCMVVKGSKSLPEILSRDIHYSQHRNYIGITCSLGSPTQGKDDYLTQQCM